MDTWIAIAALPVGAGVGLGVAALLRQSHERKTESRLVPAAINVQAAFDNVADGIIVFDKDRNIVLMNQPAVKLLGDGSAQYTAEQTAILFDFLSADGELIPISGWPSSRALCGEFMDKGEFQLHRKADGKTSIVEVSSAEVRDSTGAVRHVQIVIRDITERRQLDLHRSLLAAIVESSEDAIVGKDDHGIVTSWNRGAEKIFGYSAAEMVGQSVKRLIPADRQEEEEEILARIRRGETVDHMETKRIRKDGAEILVSATISPIRDASGRVVGASKVARDVTMQRRTERQALQSQKLAAVGQLTGGIAHDFNNLLGIVIGNLDLMAPLLEENSTAARRLRTAQKASMRGAELTRRLLAFSSNEELNPTLTQLSHTIRNTLELAQRTLGPEIKMSVQMDPDVPDLMVDRGGLDTLLLNLMLNARDAMPEGGVLTVTSQVVTLDADFPSVKSEELTPGRYARVTVSDTGHGMSRETMERAFEPFFTTKPRGRGTGLGLATAYGFARQSGGTVRIYSEVGYGTSVSFYLPIPQLTTEIGQERFTDSSTQDAVSGTVLIVDDEEDLLEIAMVYLTDMGCKVLKARNGISAMALLDGGATVDLMITDIIMHGGLSGTMLAERARALRPSLKIIYSSGFPADALAERTPPTVDAPMLRKPYQRAELQALVRRTLNEIQD